MAEGEVCEACGRLKKWAGWGTALKPAWEPVIVARKPLRGTVAENVLRYGTGGLHIDACRVGTEDNEINSRKQKTKKGVTVENQVYNGGWVGTGNGWNGNHGRYPANLIHSGEPEVVGLFPVTTQNNYRKNPCTISGLNAKKNTYGKIKDTHTFWERGYTDTGSAARFFQCCPFEAGDYDPLFYTGKATKKDRDSGCDWLEEHLDAHNLSSNACGRCGLRVKANGSGKKCECGELRETIKLPRRGNFHPTVKPLSLMRYLVRLVTPPDGLILDPFMGSGSTGKAAFLEGFRFTGIDLDPEHVAIAKARLEHIQCKQGLFANDA